MSLLRYCTARPDAAFYDAGFACKQAGDKSNAFACWSRFLDVVDAIDDPHSDIVNDDFEATDIPQPFEWAQVIEAMRNDRNLVTVLNCFFHIDVINLPSIFNNCDSSEIKVVQIFTNRIRFRIVCEK